VKLAHPSSIVSMSVYGLALLALVVVRRGVTQSLDHFGSGLWVIPASLGLFLVLVAVLQRAMGLSVGALRFSMPTNLVTRGAFQLTRNPIYCLFLVPIASLVIYSMPVAVLAAAAYVALMNWLVIPAEEALLGEKFGEAYVAYCRRTPRWLV
jgi:protein-S-isoprenylcysteine O-methyltransferase Ste14